MDEILAYMHLMLKEANYRNISITKEEFEDHGKNMEFFSGVEGWFDRITDYASRKGVKLEHYIISSGLREMIEGSSIAKNFKKIFASGYMYNQDDVAIWPALAVNYTNKTQYIFRINKGIKNSWENKRLNEYIVDEERYIPKGNIVFLGDGETDIPAMKMVKYLGGTAIVVFNPSKEDAEVEAKKLIKQERADYALPADYTQESKLERKIQELIDGIAEKNTKIRG